MARGSGTWADVQKAAEQAFSMKKDELDNPVYEVESAWINGFGTGWRAAVKTLGISFQEALDRLRASDPAGD